MAADDTIAAIATPLGDGGLGVVRLSGPAALAVAARLFRPSSALDVAAAPGHSVHHGWIRDEACAVDEAVLTVFRAPRSHTGEDVAELSCHGGAWLLRRVLELCLAGGARLAEPGEFTRRAFLNWKMDLAQAEAVAALISAKSERFRRLAADQLQGALSRYVGTLRRDLLDLLAHLEANLDFAEEEVPDLSRDALRQKLGDLLRRVRALLETAPRGRLLRDGMRAVLVGKPNVGKSSLFNALLGGDRAIVTEVPGTTRDLLEERVLLRDVPVLLTDTAGLRRTAARVESEGIRRARRALNAADVAIFVTDLSRPPTGEDREIAGLLSGKRAVLALNKCDAPRAGERASLLARLLPAAPALKTSAVSGEGLDPLREAVVGAAAPGDGREAGETPTLIAVRHERLLADAQAALSSAQEALAASASSIEECLSVDLRAALGALNELTGEGAHDEVLNAVFANFCIGK
jgi:tRNA modification GTPase